MGGRVHGRRFQSSQSAGALMRLLEMSIRADVRARYGFAWRPGVGAIGSFM